MTLAGAFTRAPAFFIDAGTRALQLSSMGMHTEITVFQEPIRDSQSITHRRKGHCPGAYQ